MVTGNAFKMHASCLKHAFKMHVLDKMEMVTRVFFYSLCNASWLTTCEHHHSLSNVTSTLPTQFNGSRNCIFEQIVWVNDSMAQLIQLPLISKNALHYLDLQSCCV